MGLPPHACEGDILVECPGGWTTIAIDPTRRDCAAEGKRCIGPLGGGWFGCEAPLGSCNPDTFKPECRPYSPQDTQGSMTVCTHGEILPGPETCFLTPSASTPSASASPPP